MKERLVEKKSPVCVESRGDNYVTDKDIVANTLKIRAHENVAEVAINSKVISSILHNIHPDLVPISHEARETTNIGDNYMSEVSSLRIACVTSSDDEGSNSNTTQSSNLTIQIFLKQAPLNESLRKMLIQCAAFTKEIQMYTNVLPALGAYFKELIPICYAVNEDECYLALEDLRLNGYKMVDRRVGLDMEHCRLAISSLAKLHALSYVKYRRNYQNIILDYPFLAIPDRIFVPEHKITDYHIAYVSQTARSYSTALREAGFETEARVLEEFFACPVTILKRLHKFTSTPTICPVIGHGDHWINNLLFKYNEKKNCPVDMKFVDFQMVRAGSRTLDLHLLWRTSLAFELTPALEKQLLRYYHDEFEVYATELGWYEPEILTIEQLEEEYNHFLEWGIYAGLFYLQFVHVEPECLNEADEFPEDEDINNNMYKFFYKLLNPSTVDQLKNVIATQIRRLRAKTTSERFEMRATIQ